MKVLKSIALLGLLCSGYSVMAMDEDEEFKRAIAESLKESEEYSAGQAEREARAEAEFEEQMRAAIAASAGRPRMTMTSFGQGSSSRQPQVTNSNRPPLSKAEREAAQAEAEFEEQMRAAIAASQQEMAGSQARQNQMPMTNFGESSSSRQLQVTNSNRPALAMEASKLADAGRRTGAGIQIFGREEPLVLELEEGTPYPTEKALTDLLNTYIPNLREVIVKKINFGRALFEAYPVEIPGEKPLLFLKISDDSSISEKLYALQKGPVGRFGSMERSNKELPIIVLPEVFFIYKDQMGNKHTIEVMQPAHGKMLSELMNEPQGDQSYAEKVGKALGLFHAYFMNYHNSGDPKDWKTMSHGDFHIDNVFYDAQRYRVYFIDNERMREGENLLIDLATLGMPLSMHGLLRYPENKRNWWSHFIKGYLSAYPVNKRKLMLDYLLSDRNDATALEKEENRRKLNTFFEQACQR